VTGFRSILRKVTRKPFTSVMNVSPASRMRDGIEGQCSKVAGVGQIAGDATEDATPGASMGRRIDVREGFCATPRAFSVISGSFPTTCAVDYGMASLRDFRDENIYLAIADDTTPT
jgi:hypothetical protein